MRSSLSNSNKQMTAITKKAAPLVFWEKQKENRSDYILRAFYDAGYHFSKVLTLEGPPPELVKRTLRSEITTKSLCSNSNSVLKERILFEPSNILPRIREVTLLRFSLNTYLSGPQSVNPKNPNREMTQLMTECLRIFIHWN